MQFTDCLDRLNKLTNTFYHYDSLKERFVKAHQSLPKPEWYERDYVAEDRATYKKRIEEFDAGRKKALDDVWTFEKQVMAEFKIDSKTMCQLLEGATGIRWKVMQIGGYHIEPSADYMNEKYINNAYYGVALVNENHPQFNQRYLVGDHIKSDSLDIIVGQKETAKIALVNDTMRQDVVDNFNWLHYYLYLGHHIPRQVWQNSKSKFNDSPAFWRRRDGNVAYYYDFGQEDNSATDVGNSILRRRNIISCIIDLHLKDIKKTETQPAEEPAAE